MSIKQCVNNKFNGPMVTIKTDLEVHGKLAGQAKPSSFFILGPLPQSSYVGTWDLVEWADERMVSDWIELNWIESSGAATFCSPSLKSGYYTPFKIETATRRWRLRGDANNRSPLWWRVMLPSEELGGPSSWVRKAVRLFTFIYMTLENGHYGWAKIVLVIVLRQLCLEQG